MGNPGTPAGTGTPRGHKATYRPEIDGFRSVAVLPVILFHAGFGLFAGGFVGVDIFFVISGYLITGIIHGEILSGRFSIIQFYERRARRILPALFLVLAVSVCLASIWMLPLAYEGFSRSLVAVNVFVSNVLFWRDSGYFDLANELKPLLHTWSLSVEEQFYVFFPLILVLMRKLRTGMLSAVVGGLTLASLLASVWASTRLPGANFYLLPTRAWELGAGALVALVRLEKRTLGRFACEALSMAGAAMILFAIFSYDANTPFPGVAALPPVVGTVLVIACARPGTFIGNLLSCRPLVAIGLISYSAYLWHQVVFVFARLRSLDELGTAAYLGLVVLSLALAYLSWRFVEAPFRDRTRTSRRLIFTGSALGAAAFIAIGALGMTTAGLPARLPADVVKIAALSEERGLPPCEPQRRDGGLAVDQCIYGEGSRQIVLWGDSHAKALSEGLLDVLGSHDASLVSLTVPACLPVIGWNLQEPACEDFRRNTIDYLTAARDPGTVVVVHGRWVNMLGHRNFDNGEGGKELGTEWNPRLAGFRGTNPADPAYVSWVSGLVTATIRPLLEAGQRVVLVYSVPSIGWNAPDFRARALLFGVDRPDLGVDHSRVRQWHAATDAILDSLGEHENLLRVRVEDLLCDRQTPGRCMAEQAGTLFFVDDNHISRAAARLLGSAILDEVMRNGWM